MTHSLFIAAAYAVAAIGLGALTLYLLADNYAQRRALSDLEARGVRRRSERRRP